MTTTIQHIGSAHSFCPCCGEQNEAMGTLGYRTHYRCCCCWQWSEEIGAEEIEEHRAEMEIFEIEGGEGNG